VQRHQLFPQRVPRGQLAQLAGDLGVPSQRQLGVDELLGGARPILGQPVGRHPDRAAVRGPVERVTPPQPERPPQQRRHPGRVIAGRPRVAHQIGEGKRVHGAPVHGEQVPVAPSPDRGTLRPEYPAQLGNRRVHLGDHGPRRILVPPRRDQLVQPHHPPGRQRQRRQHRPRLRVSTIESSNSDPPPAGPVAEHPARGVGARSDTGAVWVIGESSEDGMIACFLLGELTSERFGAEVRRALLAAGQPERLLTDADLADPEANRARRDLLTAVRGYGENRDVFEDFPARVRWIRAVLKPDELAHVRYIEYSYWNELSGGSRLSLDAAKRIRAGVEVFGVSNRRFVAAARAVQRGERFPPLILVGRRRDALVCLEGHLRLTAYALAGFPVEVECLIGTARSMDRWAR
jgi:hypothetical protein